MTRVLFASAIFLAIASTVSAASFGVIDAVSLTGTSVTSISIHGQAVPAADLVSGKLTTLTSTLANAEPPVLNRVIVPDPLPLPSTNSAVWNLSGDLDVATGLQMFPGTGSHNFFFSAPLTTTASVDVVFLAHYDGFPAYQFEAIDAAGDVIPAAGLVSWTGTPNPYTTQPKGLWGLPPSQYTDTTASGAPGDAPVYGTPIPVGVLSGPVNGGLGIAVNFDSGVQIHGVRLTMTGFDAFEMSEVLGIKVATPVPPPPQQTTLVVNNVSLNADIVTGVTVNNVAIPVANLVSAKPTTLTSLVDPIRIIVRDEAPLPTTNAGVWDLMGDNDVMTGYQIHAGAGPQTFKLAAPITTGGTADVVVLAHLPGANIEFNAVDAAGNIIQAAGTVLWTESLHAADPRGLWSTPAADFVDTTASGASGDAPVYGALFNVGGFSGVNGGFGIALKFAEGIEIHGIKITSYSGAIYIDEVFGVIGSSPLVPGDFDSDGDVDGADFVAWQTNFPKASGATLDEGDADGDGDVDGADFVVWQTNFPFTPSPGQTPIPEPQTWVMAAITVLGISVRYGAVRQLIHR
jgi:hypothetical protein